MERIVVQPRRAARLARLLICTATTAIGGCLLPGALLAQSPMTPASPTAAPSPQMLGPTKDTSGPPRWPTRPTAPAGAPNVLLILTDDVGFGATSTFGGPIPTPTFDRLAGAGLRYSQFNTTALCSPTRASLLTGRTPHNVGMGNVTNIPAGYDGYTSVIPKSAGTVAEVLRQGGYNTAMFGKSHLTPEWEMSASGPFDRWPTGLGFEYFYGFLSADASMFAPGLTENTRPVEPPHNDPGYHFERDIADHAIAWLRDQHAATPDKPFFMYYSTGASHTPHHAPPEWLAKFRGKFDAGWDAMREQTLARQKQLGVVPKNTDLTARPAGMPAWSSLSADEKLVASRLFEAFAAETAYTDAQIGRVIDELTRTGQLHNTLIVFIQGDNGGSAEGGLGGEAFEQAQIYAVSDTLQYKLQHIDEIGSASLYNHFNAPWGWAQSAPFQWNKQVASHFGGTRNGMVIAWPGHIPTGGVRTQFHHVSDVMPTILEAARVAAPADLNGVAQQPLDGISMAYSFTQPQAPSARRTQVFEMMQNMGIYHDGWFAGTTPARMAWNTRVPVPPPGERKWELYHIAEDFSEAHDLAATNPGKLEAMKELFWAEAGRTKVLPIHGNSDSEGRPILGNVTNPMVYTAPVTRIPENAAPQLIGQSFTIDAEVIVPQQGATGVLVAQGGRYGGYAFYLDRIGQLRFHHNGSGPRQYAVTSTRAVPAGRHTLTADYTEKAGAPRGTGTMVLKVDGRAVGQGEIVRGIPHWVSHTEGFDVGRDTITPVVADYTVATSGFTGSIEKLSVTVKK